MSDTGKYIFTWSVENFFSYFYESGKYLVSPEFTIEPFKSTKWSVSFLSCRGNFMRNNSVSCTLKRSNTCMKPEKVEISYDVKLIGPCKTLFSSWGTETQEFAKGDSVDLISNKSFSEIIVEDNMYCGDEVTIRLVLLSKEFNGSRDIECIARTKVSGDQCSFEWKFKAVYFPLFKTFPCYREMQIELEINSSSADKVKVVVNRTKKSSVSQFLKCKIYFVDSDGIKMGSMRYARWFLSTATDWKFETIVTRNFLKEQSLTNSIVTLLCECCISNGTLSSELKYIQGDVSPDTTVQILQSDFQRMYLDKILSDVQLIVDDEKFLAHKCVLCSRSPVFLAMFSQKMAECETSFVKISDTDSRTFASFLKFLYTGELDFDSWENALKVLMCADKYQVSSLKDSCSNFLIADLCEKNACQILVVADMVTMKRLKSCAIRRIDAHASRIFKSADWIQVLEHYPKLATEVLSILSSEFRPSRYTQFKNLDTPLTS